MHVPVLLKESIDLLVSKPDGIYIDGTLGRGGHTVEILKRLGADGRLIAFDRDLQALEQTKDILKPFGERVKTVHGNFSEMKAKCEQMGVERVDGILMDLGVSSPQLDVAERGFSFGKDGPLDMRMDRSQSRTAADWVNQEDEQILADIIFRFGEERDSRRIAAAIVRSRAEKPILSTSELAAIVEKAKGGRRGPTHPATKTFQAIRMAVNAELESLEQGLEAGLNLLADGGRMAVITFHSLEDRMVKENFKRHSVKRESLQQGGERLVYDEPPVKLITKKPVTASVQELENNPRSRSAKLRVAERKQAA